MNYFQKINQTLQNHDRAIPFLFIDLGLLNKNITTLQKQIQPTVSPRIVVKSLPSLPLLDYITKAVGTQKLMVFHQPFLSQIASTENNQLDILLGKPMPVQTVRYFYKKLNTQFFDGFRQIQWLVDTPERLLEYIELAQSLGQKLRINLELNIGLHRGGLASIEQLREMLLIIQKHSKFVAFSGLMGYDPHVVNLPKILISPQKAFHRSNDFYKKCQEMIQQEFPQLWHSELTFNGGGSPTLQLHFQEKTALNDISIGSCLVKPSYFDIPTLEEFEPAAFIATPILKKSKHTTLPLLERWKKLLSFVKPSFKFAYFIYGGYWKADYVYPKDATENQIFGSSTNQSMVNSKMELTVGDFIFLRPKQSEHVFLQFGKLLILENNEIVDEWLPLDNS